MLGEWTWAWKQFHPYPFPFARFEWSWPLCVHFGCSVVSDSVTPWTVAHQGPCPWNSPGKNTGVGSQSLLQGIFLIHGSNPHLLHCRQVLYHLSHQGGPGTFYIKRKTMDIDSCLQNSSSHHPLICQLWLLCVNFCFFWLSNPPFNSSFHLWMVTLAPTHSLLTIIVDLSWINFHSLLHVSFVYFPPIPLHNDTCLCREETHVFSLPRRIDHLLVQDQLAQSALSWHPLPLSATVQYWSSTLLDTEDTKMSKTTIPALGGNLQSGGRERTANKKIYQ